VKRSEINAIMKSADAFIRSCGLLLPPFAYWTPDDWQSKGPEVREIVDNKLGWDITDFGSGKFNEIGLFLFTVRNGHPDNLKSGRGKLYAEKLLIAEPKQVTPFHYHWHKVEDFVNRGGGRLIMQLHHHTSDDRLDDERTVTVSLDGVQRTVAPGEHIELRPGESITLPVEVYHKFWAEDERVLIGEISNVNDDNHDNRFLGPVGRFAEIEEEDEPPLHLLATDYANYYPI